MSSMLIQPPIESDFCRSVYVEEPGDFAEEVCRSNMLAALDALPTGMFLGVFHRTSSFWPPVYVRSAADISIGVNLRPIARMKMTMAGERRNLGLSSGSLLITPSDCDMRWEYTEAREMSCLQFSFSMNRFESMAYSLGVPLPQGGLPAICASQSDSQAILLGRAILAELKSEQGMPLLLETLVAAFLLYVFRRTKGEPIKAGPHSAGLSPKALNCVTEYIEAYLHGPLSLEHLAQLAGLSLYHFCRMFKQSTGMPPHRYVAHTRIGRAKRLLLQTDLSIREISYQTGFSSSSQLGHAFKKVMKCTPLEYRRQSSTKILSVR